MFHTKYYLYIKFYHNAKTKSSEKENKNGKFQKGEKNVNIQ